jgi:hypothetical protein
VKLHGWKPETFTGLKVQLDIVEFHAAFPQFSALLLF